jgi:hypothetical protein
MEDELDVGRRSVHRAVLAAGQAVYLVVVGVVDAFRIARRLDARDAVGITSAHMPCTREPELQPCDLTACSTCHTGRRPPGEDLAQFGGPLQKVRSVVRPRTRRGGGTRAARRPMSASGDISTGAIGPGLLAGEPNVIAGGFTR